MSQIERRRQACAACDKNSNGLCTMTGAAIEAKISGETERCPLRMWDEQPGLLTKAVNLGKAIVNHIADGLVEVSQDQYLARLATCDTCPNRSADWECNQCGCYITIKAKWRSEKCPLAMWPGDSPEAPLPPKRSCCGG